MNPGRRNAWLGSLSLALVVSCATTPACDSRSRPLAWAQPVSVAGGPGNWYRVTADLHRSEQPSAREMRVLETYGIRSVVNLREFHSDGDEAADTAITIREVELDAAEMTYSQLVTALSAVIASPKPTLVHCWHGSDRTGAVVAAWRVAVDGWTPEQALEEMAAGGFGHHERYQNLRDLISGLDPARLRADVGLPPR